MSVQFLIPLMAVHSRSDVAKMFAARPDWKRENEKFILPMAKINSMGHGHMRSENTIHEQKNHRKKKIKTKFSTNSSKQSPQTVKCMYVHQQFSYT